MAHDPITPMQKGHFIHGSGTTTVYHRRGLGTVNGIWPVMTYHESDVADISIDHASDHLVVTCAGNWKIVLGFLSELETGPAAT
jgi:hypothetical protein